MNQRYVSAFYLSMISASLGGCNGEPGRSDDAVELAASAYSTNGVDVTLSVTSDWGGGFCANVTLSNNSSVPVTNWTVHIALNQSTVGDVWSGTSKVSGGVLTVAPAGYNANIGVKGQSSFGFCGSAPTKELRPTVTSATIVGGTVGAGGSSSVGGTTTRGGSSSVGGTTTRGGSSSVGGSSGSNRVFSQCRFHFGTIDSVAKNAGSAVISQLDFFTPGWMMNASFDQKYVCDEGNPGGALANQVPMIVTYIAANYVKNYVSPKLCDCNVGGCGYTSGKTNDLCNFGAERIVANWSKIIDAYKSYSAGYAACYGTTRPIVFKMEPDWYQYTDGSQSAPWSAAQAGSRMSEIVKALKTSLPNARFAIDVSPWVAPNNGSDNGAAWFANFDMSLFSFVATSGGGTNANTAKIRSSNNMTWAGLNQVTGKPILADTGYGANGMSAGHDANWDVATNVNARIADGVIAIAQYNPNSSWGSTIASLRSQLNAPKYCP
jgi:hypothetical protein